MSEMERLKEREGRRRRRQETTHARRIRAGQGVSSVMDVEERKDDEDDCQLLFATRPPPQV